jgi:hypothetical protein
LLAKGLSGRSSICYYAGSKWYSGKKANGIRVKNGNVEAFFLNLTEAAFYRAYKEICIRLPFNFIPVAHKTLRLTPQEETCLVQKAAISLLYPYTANNLPLNFDLISLHTTTVIDTVISLLDKKDTLQSADTKESLTLGAHLLRQPLEEYQQTVVSRRRYYDR